MFEESQLQTWLDAHEPGAIALDNQAASAVLVPLFCRAGAWHVWLIKRGDALRHHAGQIGFPGGRVERDDASALATALRESQEEIGLDPADVRVLGRLDDAVTFRGFHIVPFVGVVPDPYPFQLASGEVEALFAVPLAFFTDPGRLRVESFWRPGEGPRELLFFDVDRAPDQVWGATARILKTWLDRFLPSL